MAHIFKIAFYMVDPDNYFDESIVKEEIEQKFDGYPLHQLHVEQSEHYWWKKDQPENYENCDLADLEKHFSHKMNGNPKLRPLAVGGIYRHFKGHNVKVLACSIGTEYGEKIVVYEHLGDHTIWHRPLEMFLSEVEHDKYPDVAQKWRFELVCAKEARFE